MAKTKAIDIELIKQEVKVSTSRSGGPGGQHVNKVETKVQLSLDIKNSSVLSNIQKSLLQSNLKSVLTSEGKLSISESSTRSQKRNKDLAFIKLENILNKALEKKKKRKQTRPPKSATEDRLKEKKIQSEKKKMRKDPSI